MLTLEPPGLGEGYRLDAIGIDAATAEKGMVATDEQGRVESGNHRLSAIEPLVPVYSIVGGHFPLSSDRGHHLFLRFHSNDLGTAALDRETLAFTPRGLVLNRYGSEIRFIQVRP